MRHRLTYQQGPCRTNHSHTYRLRIDIEGELNGDGMVIDYYNIDKVVLPFLQTLDHAFLVDDKDISMIEFLEANELKMKVIPFYSTAENIAAFIMNELYPAFVNPGNLIALTLRIYETDDVFAEITKKL